MELDTFADERMKILYALSFMCGGIAQVWAKNETNAILSYTSTFATLTKLLSSIERTFGDPDRERMAHAQLHTLKMTGHDGRQIHGQIRDVSRQNRLQRCSSG